MRKMCASNNNNKRKNDGKEMVSSKIFLRKSIKPTLKPYDDDDDEYI